MRATIDANINVDAPVDQTYEQWEEIESFPQFMSGVENIERVEDNKYHWQIKIGGVTREFDAAVVEKVRDDHITWASLDGTNTGTVAFEPLDDAHTRVKVKFEWQSNGFTEAMAQTLQLDDLQVNASLREFKELLETKLGTDSGS